MRSYGFGPMSINKGPKRRIDGQASLHATSVSACGLVVEVPKRFFGWPALLIRVRNLAASRHPRGGFFNIEMPPANFAGGFSFEKRFRIDTGGMMRHLGRDVGHSAQVNLELCVGNK